VDLGFHLVVKEYRTAAEVLRRMDEIAAALGLSSRAAEEYGFHKRFYRLNERHPELPVAFEFQAEHYEVAMYPLEEKEMLAYTPEALVKFWSQTGRDLNGCLGRTFFGMRYGTVRPAEIEGPLQFVDWYQYFSPRIVDRWGISYLRKGPFYKVEEYSNGACGIWLTDSPLKQLGRRKAAEYLGIELPKLYVKNPQTGEQVEVPWH
jgi:hypothetical protein